MLSFVGEVLMILFDFRLVVSSLEVLESCFAVGSSNEKVNRLRLFSLLKKTQS